MVLPSNPPTTPIPFQRADQALVLRIAASIAAASRSLVTRNQSCTGTPGSARSARSARKLTFSLIGAARARLGCQTPVIAGRCAIRIACTMASWSASA